MKMFTRFAVGAIVTVFAAAVAADSQTPPAEPQVRIFVYPTGKFFTPSDIPEMKDFYCLTGLGVDGTLEVHCAPSPFLT